MKILLIILSCILFTYSAYAQEDDGSALPALERIAPENDGSALPALERIAPENDGSALPALERIAPENDGSALPALERILPENDGSASPASEEMIPADNGLVGLVPPYQETLSESDGFEVYPYEGIIISKKNAPIFPYREIILKYDASAPRSYQGFMQSKYLFDTHVQLKPLNEDSFGIEVFPVQKHSIVSYQNGTTAEKNGYQFFRGRSKGRFAIEYTFGTTGTRTTQYLKGQKFTLNGEEHEFTEDSTFTSIGFYAATAINIKFIQINNLSFYTRPLIGLRAMEYEGIGSYKTTDPDCATEFLCEEEETLGFHTVSGTNDPLFFVLPIGVEYIAIAGQGIRAEYNPRAAQIEIGFIFPW